jgi:hypothetical protein
LVGDDKDYLGYRIEAWFDDSLSFRYFSLIGEGYNIKNDFLSKTAEQVKQRIDNGDFND